MCLMRKVSWSVQFWWLLLLYLTQILLCCVSAEVPDDVFAPDFLWKGSYDYKGQKQPLTLTVSSFNTTSGKVNATLADTSVEFLLSGETSINHLSLPYIYFEKVLCMHQSTTKPSHAPECQLNIVSKDRCVGLCSLLAHSWAPPRPLASSSALAAILLLCILSSALFRSLLLCYLISSHSSRPLCCRSIQTPGGTVNAAAIPDESAGPQLLEQDYWWVLGNGWICESTLEFAAAGQKLTGNCRFLSSAFTPFFLFLGRD